MKLLTLISFLSLTACGTGEMSDAQKEAAIEAQETSEEIPSLKGWQIMPGAEDSCLQVGSDNMECKSEFQGGDRNCSDATFKFIVKKDGYMHVITVEHVFIRQGEAHTVRFEGKPETFNIESLASEQYHAFQCYGSNGEVIKL